MSKGVQFVVLGNPLPKQSTRFATKGGGKVKVHTYTEPRIQAYQNEVGWLARSAMEGRVPLEGDLALMAVFTRSDRRVVDLDNLCKAVCDGMNGIVQVDDSQFVEKHLYKEYDKANPGVKIRVTQL